MQIERFSCWFYNFISFFLPNRHSQCRTLQFYLHVREHLTNQEKNRLERPRKIAQRIIGIDLPNIESRYIKQSTDEVKSIMKDITHPLNSCYNIFNRSGIRLCPTPTRISRFRNSFFPWFYSHFQFLCPSLKSRNKKVEGGYIQIRNAI